MGCATIFHVTYVVYRRRVRTAEQTSKEINIPERVWFGIEGFFVCINARIIKVSDPTSGTLQLHLLY